MSVTFVKPSKAFSVRTGARRESLGRGRVCCPGTSAQPAAGARAALRVTLVIPPAAPPLKRGSVFRAHVGFLRPRRRAVTDLPHSCVRTSAESPLEVWRFAAHCLSLNLAVCLYFCAWLTHLKAHRKTTKLYLWNSFIFLIPSLFSFQTINN